VPNMHLGLAFMTFIGPGLAGRITPPVSPSLFLGPVAHLGERLLCKQEAAGSIPARSIEKL
jgi:hypothetical protein